MSERESEILNYALNTKKLLSEQCKKLRANIKGKKLRTKEWKHRADILKLVILERFIEEPYSAFRLAEIASKSKIISSIFEWQDLKDLWTVFLIEHRSDLIDLGRRYPIDIDDYTSFQKARGCLKKYYRYIKEKKCSRDNKKSAKPPPREVSTLGKARLENIRKFCELGNELDQEFSDAKTAINKMDHLVFDFKGNKWRVYITDTKWKLAVKLEGISNDNEISASPILDSIADGSTDDGPAHSVMDLLDGRLAEETLFNYRTYAIPEDKLQAIIRFFEERYEVNAFVFYGRKLPVVDYHTNLTAI